MRRIVSVTYKLYLYAILDSVYPILHVFMLKKCVGDHSLVVPMEDIGLKDSLSYK